MTPDRFEASFVVQVDRDVAWRRLTEHPIEGSGSTRCWLPGFDTRATIDASREGERLELTKDDEPCAGTTIVVTLTDVEHGTKVTVVQSRFGDWLPARYGFMQVGWRHIVADLHTYLATGAHAARHLRPWGDLGADVTPTDGGLRIGEVRADTLAQRLGLAPDDLLVVLGAAPVSSPDDLVTILRVLAGRSGDVEAEWVRDGAMQRAVAMLG